MHKMTANLQIYRQNCLLDCTKYYVAPVIPRKTELISFSGECTVRVREVEYDILSGNSFKIRLLLEELFSDNQKKNFGPHDCFDAGLVFYDHVWVTSANVKRYTLYKSGYDGERPILLNKEAIEKFQKNFC